MAEGGTSNHFYPQNKEPNIEQFISRLFKSGLDKPVGILLAGCFIAFLVGGWPILIGFPAVLLAIYVVSAYPS